MKRHPLIVAALLASSTLLAASRAAGQEKILFVADDGLRVASADGSGATSIAAGKDGLRVVAPRWSPDGRKIAFVGGKGMPQDLYVVNADGSDLKLLTTARKMMDSARQPAWSPDGRRIAFVSGGMLENDIWVMDADGSNARNLTGDGAKDSAPAWSPDGRSLAYVSADPVATPGGGSSFNVTDIRIIGADGSGKRKLTDDEATDGDPVWSPDGRQIVFTVQVVLSKEGNATVIANPDIWIANADGSGRRSLTNNANKGEDRSPAWSPDGRTIAFAARKNGGPCGIYTMSADGSGVKALTELRWGPEYHEVRWSADGKKLLAMDGRDAIVTMNADGSGLTKVAKGASPSWSPAR